MLNSVRLLRQRPGPLITISIAYFAAASGLMIWRGISVSPDYILLLLVPVALLSGRLLGYLRDWVPFIAIFLGWEAMRGIAPKLGIAPHVSDLVSLERTVFLGHIPSAELQAWITGPAQTWVALACTVIYFMHFIFPLAVGMVLWLADRTQFLRFTTALMGMAFVCFFIFLLVPTAPPWYAENVHAVSGIHKLIYQQLPSMVSPYYNSLNPNKVAAFPSLHAAFPFLGFLALRRLYPRASWIAFIWCLMVWFSVVFLGEHWGVDVISGVVMAAASWWVLMHVAVPRVAALQHRVSVARETGLAEAVA